MGKNTMMKRCIRLYVERTGDDKWTPLMEALVGNVGMIFTKARHAGCSTGSSTMLGILYNDL